MESYVLCTPLAMVAALLLAALSAQSGEAEPCAGSAPPSSPSWCYEQAWCSRLGPLPPPDDRQRATWPCGVTKLVYFRSNRKQDVLDSVQFTGDRQTLDMAFESVLKQGLYPITIRKKANTGKTERPRNLDGTPLAKGPTPAFLAPAVDVDVLKGEPVQLQCSVTRKGERHVVWSRTPPSSLRSANRRHRTVALATGMLVLDPKRFSVDNRSSLILRNATQIDRATYYCSLGGLIDFEQANSVNVLVSTRLEKSKHILKEVEIAWCGTHSLICKVSGNPNPIVKWLKEGTHDFLNATSSQTLEIHNASRADAGSYVCAAYNGLGDPVLQTYDVIVQHPPEINCYDEASTQGDLLLRNVSIICLVDAYPMASEIFIQVPSKSLRTANLTKSLVHTSILDNIQILANANFSFFSITVHCLETHNLGIFSFAVSNSVKLSPFEFNLTDHTRQLYATVVDDTLDAHFVHFVFQYKSNLPPTRLYFLYRLRQGSDPDNYELLCDQKGQVVRPNHWITDRLIEDKHQHADTAKGRGYVELTKNREADPLRAEIEKMRLEENADYDAIVQLKNDYAWSAPLEFYFHVGVGKLVRMTVSKRAMPVPNISVAAAASWGTAFVVTLVYVSLCATKQ